MNIKKISLVVLITLLVGATLSGFFTSVKGETGEVLWTHDEHSDQILSVHAEDGIVYSGSSDETVKAYDGESEELLWTHEEHSDDIESIYADDGIVYSGSSDETVKAYDGESEELLWTHDEHSDQILSVYAEDGIVYSAGTDNKVIASDSENGELLWEHEEHSNSIYSVYAEDGIVYSGGYGDSVKAYDGESEELLWTHEEHSDDIESIYADDGIVYSGSSDETVKAYDGESEELLWTHEEHPSGILSVHAENGIVYSGGWGDDEVIAYDGESEELLWTHEEHSETVNSVHTEDGIVYSGSNDNTVMSYNDPYNNGTEEETTNYTLDIDSKGNGTTDPEPGTHTYENGTEVNITASPDSDYKFVNWTGDIDSEDKNETITMDQDYNITANFEEDTTEDNDTEDPENYTLEINIEGNGTVELDPDQDNYTEGTEVELTAIPEDNATFSSWSGEVGSQDDLETETITVVMDKNRTITATFEETEPDTWTGIENTIRDKAMILAGGILFLAFIFIIAKSGSDSKW